MPTSALRVSVPLLLFTWTLTACAGGEEAGGTSSAQPSRVGSATLFPDGHVEDEESDDESAIGFPDVGVRESVEKNVEMRNDMDRGWKHDAPRVTTENEARAAAPGPAAAGAPEGFKIVEDKCGKGTIPPGGSCTFRIRYTAVSDKPPAMVLEIKSPTNPIRTAVAVEGGPTAGPFPDDRSSGPSDSASPDDRSSGPSDSASPEPTSSEPGGTVDPGGTPGEGEIQPPPGDGDPGVSPPPEVPDPAVPPGGGTGGTDGVNPG